MSFIALLELKPDCDIHWFDRFEPIVNVRGRETDMIPCNRSAYAATAVFHSTGPVELDSFSQLINKLYISCKQKNPLDVRV